ncbi:MAG: hypothetical protein IJ104_08390 [Methanobrevibacter sp.]|nr:hypothetical protein [Methanobrevibacter sp.]
MINEHLIYISDKLDSHLGMNFVAKEFFDEINSSDFNRFVVDFSNVKFMSRSFTQEYLFQKFETDKEIVEINVPAHVKKMFDVVSKDFE